jgi:hypothetical protein
MACVVADWPDVPAGDELAANELAVKGFLGNVCGTVTFRWRVFPYINKHRKALVSSDVTTVLKTDTLVFAA